MQDIVALLILLVILGAAARYVYKAKKNGARCIGCSASGSCSAKGKGKNEVSLTPQIEAAFPHVYTIGVDGMTCSNCTGHVEKAFFSAGYLCKADLKSKTAEVRSRQPVDPEVLGKIVTDAGYTFVA